MPVIIPKDKEDLRLYPKTTEEEKLLPLLAPYPAEGMEFYRVSPIMNKPDYDFPEVINQVKG